ncbi:hypothetical protein YC2023_035808 [Brassica napus]
MSNVYLNSEGSLHFGRVRSVVLDRGNVDMTWLSKMEIIPPEVIETPHRKSCIARRGGELTQSVEEEKVYLTAAEEGMLLLLHEVEEKKRRVHEHEKLLRECDELKAQVRMLLRRVSDLERVL